MSFSNFGQHLVTFLMISLQITKKTRHIGRFHTKDGLMKSGGLSIQTEDRSIFELRRFTRLTRILQRITRLKTNNLSLVCWTGDTAIDTLSASYPDVSLSRSKCMHKGRREGGCTLPMVPCGSSPVARLYLVKTKHLRRRLILCSNINLKVQFISPIDPSTVF